MAPSELGPHVPVAHYTHTDVTRIQRARTHVGGVQLFCKRRKGRGKVSRRRRDFFGPLHSISHEFAIWITFRELNPPPRPQHALLTNERHSYTTCTWAQPAARDAALEEEARSKKNRRLRTRAGFRSTVTARVGSCTCRPCCKR